MRRLLVATLALFPLVGSASVGQLYKTGGNVDLTREGRVLNAVAGSPVEIGDAYSTRPAQQVAFQMRDDSVISLSPSTSFQVLSYRFEPNNPGSNQARYRLESGSARLVSGLIAEQQKGADVLETPYGESTATNTDYVAVFCSSCSTPGLYIAVNTGGLTFSNASGSADVAAGQIVFVAGGNVAPVLIDKLPPELALAPDPNRLLLAAAVPGASLRVEAVPGTVVITDPICDEPSSPTLPQCIADR